MANPKTIRCPKCQKKLRIGSVRPGSTIPCPACQHPLRFLSKPAATPPPVPQPEPEAPASDPLAIDTTKSPVRASRKTSKRRPAAAIAPTASSSPPGNPIPTAAFGRRLLLAAKSKPWIFAVLTMATLLLLVTLANGQQMYVIGLLGLVPAAVVAGLLRIRRRHVLRRLTGSMKRAAAYMASAAASIGTLGVLLLLFKGGGKMFAAAQRGQANGLDFAKLLEPRTYAGLAASGVLVPLLIFVVVVSLLLGLWYFLGLVRTIALGYLIPASVLTITFFIALFLDKPGGTTAATNARGNGFPEPNWPAGPPPGFDRGGPPGAFSPPGQGFGPPTGFSGGPPVPGWNAVPQIDLSSTAVGFVTVHATHPRPPGGPALRQRLGRRLPPGDKTFTQSGLETTLRIEWTGTADALAEQIRQTGMNLTQDVDESNRHIEVVIQPPR